MKDSSVSQKENILFRIDGGKLSKTADGKIIMGNKPTILTWFGIVFFAVLALGILVLMIASMIRDISLFAQNLIGGVIAVGLFGYIAFSTYQRSQRGQLIIDPTARKVISLKREVNFDTIEGVIAHRKLLQPSSRRSATIVTFQALVTNESPVLLGSISGGKKKTEEKAEQIIGLLEETGLAVKKV